MDSVTQNTGISKNVSSRLYEGYEASYEHNIGPIGHGLSFTPGGTGSAHESATQSTGIILVHTGVSARGGARYHHPRLLYERIGNDEVRYHAGYLIFCPENAQSTPLARVFCYPSRRATRGTGYFTPLSSTGGFYPSSQQLQQRLREFYLTEEAIYMIQSDTELEALVSSSAIKNASMELEMANQQFEGSPQSTGTKLVEDQGEDQHVYPATTDKRSSQNKQTGDASGNVQDKTTLESGEEVQVQINSDSVKHANDQVVKNGLSSSLDSSRQLEDSPRVTFPEFFADLQDDREWPSLSKDIVSSLPKGASIKANNYTKDQVKSHPHKNQGDKNQVTIFCDGGMHQMELQRCCTAPTKELAADLQGGENLPSISVAWDPQSIESNSNLGIDDSIKNKIQYVFGDDRKDKFEILDDSLEHREHQARMDTLPEIGSCCHHKHQARMDTLSEIGSCCHHKHIPKAPLIEFVANLDNETSWPALSKVRVRIPHSR